MKRKRFLALSLIVAMTASLVVGCGSSEKAKSKENAKEVTIWLEKVFSDEANTEMEKRIKSFEEKTGTKVNYEFLAATDYMTKLNAAIEAGSNVPDITAADVSKVINYYPSNPYEEMDDLVEEINEERPYMEAVYNGSSIDGKHYFVPMMSSSNLMFIRKDLMEKNGITEIPENWNDLFAAAEKMSDPENGVYGLGLGCGPTDEDGENMFRNILWNQGGYVFDKDGNVTLDNKVTEELLTKYKDMYDKEIIPASASTWDPGGNNTSYLMGESAIVFNAPTLYNALKSDEANSELLKNTEIVKFPKGSDNDITLGFIRGLSIMKDGKNKDEAEELVKYLLDKEWLDSYLNLTAPVFAPVFEDMKDDDNWNEGINSQVIEYVENSTGYYGYPVEKMEGRAVAAKNYYTFPMAKMMNQVVTGSEDINGAINGAIKSIKEVQGTIK